MNSSLLQRKTGPEKTGGHQWSNIYK